MKLIHIGILAAFAAFCLGLISSAAAQTEGQVQYDNHPCGKPGFSLDNIRMFFHQAFRARHTELTSMARETYINHHEAHDLGITRVFVFQSRMHEKFAVVAAKKIDDIWCIVQLKDQLALEFSPEHLRDILSKQEDNI